MHVFIYPSKKKETPKKKPPYKKKEKKEINIEFTTRNVNVNLHVISEIILMVEWECFIIKKKVHGVRFYILNTRSQFKWVSWQSNAK